jgi:hypothetical protein
MRRVGGQIGRPRKTPPPASASRRRLLHPRASSINNSDAAPWPWLGLRSSFTDGTGWGTRFTAAVASVGSTRKHWKGRNRW